MSTRRSRSTSAPPRRPPPTAPPRTAAPAGPSLVERLQTYAPHGPTRTIALGLMLVFFAANGIVAARTNTPTIDEFVYVPIGYYHLRTGDLTFDTTNPPLMKLAMALPLLGMRLTL